MLNVIVGEFDGRGSGGDGQSSVCARQPRTLSMAIVPGDHIKSILLAQRENIEETAGEREDLSTSDSVEHDTTSNAECVSTL